MPYKEVSQIYFKGVKVSNTSYEQVYNSILEDHNTSRYICVTDVRNLMWATQDARLRAAINESWFSTPDGMPLVWYGRLLGCRRIRRLPGGKLLGETLHARDGLKHFLLGDTVQTIQRVMRKARSVQPGLRIAGYSPPFVAHFTEQDNQRIADEIRSFDPDVIWVAFGGGKQEKWMHQHVQDIDRGVMIGVGAAFKFYLGDLKIPPQWIQSLALQWLSRYLQEFERRGRRSSNASLDPTRRVTVAREAEHAMTLPKVRFLYAFLPELIHAMRRRDTDRDNAW